MPFQKGNKACSTSGFLGKHHSEESKKKMSEAKKGNKAWTGKHHSEETKKKLREVRKGHFFGAKNPNWKGGIKKDKKYTSELAKRRRHKRRALKKGADGSFTLVEWELLKKQYGHRCPVCNRKEPKVKLTIDHIIPLLKGDSNYIENIQPLCQSCNSKKHTKIFRITPKGELMLF